MITFEAFFKEASFNVAASTSRNTRLPQKSTTPVAQTFPVQTQATSKGGFPTSRTIQPSRQVQPAASVDSMVDQLIAHPMNRAFAQQPQVASPQQQVAPAVTQRNVTTASYPVQTTAPTTIAKTAPGQNGRLTASQLAQVEPGHFLTPTAANSFQQMKAAAAKDGVNLNINNAYRSYENQVKMANQYGLYSKGGKAAVPGTSNHGLGKAVDLNVKANPGSFEWLKSNASKYGFYNIPREPWHWEVRTA